MNIKRLPSDLPRETIVPSANSQVIPAQGSQKETQAIKSSAYQGPMDPNLLTAPKDLFSKVSRLLESAPAQSQPKYDFVDKPFSLYAHPEKQANTPFLSPQKTKPIDSIYATKPPPTAHLLETQPRPASRPVETQKSPAKIASSKDLPPASHVYEKSPNHSKLKFEPAFPIMAYHESGQYRTKSDPYAVGAITKPSRSQDKGGKTYGTYQFESYVYRNGTKGKGTKSSTLQRFLKSKGNPFSAELKATQDKHGIASPQFDAHWKKLATTKNKAFGHAQQNFLLEDKKASVEAFMKKSQLGPEAKKDPRIFDLILGTKNHVDTLSNSIPGHLVGLQKNKGRKLTSKEVGQAITSYKQTKIKGWFVSSPKAHKGIRNRFRDEARIFK